LKTIFNINSTEYSKPEVSSVNSVILLPENISNASELYTTSIADA
jgi:hypothetical protein